MSNLVGNRDARFSHVEAHLYDVYALKYILCEAHGTMKFIQRQ